MPGLAATPAQSPPKQRSKNCQHPDGVLAIGDDIVAAAMIDRLVHHAEIVALKGDSYRLKDRDLVRPASD